MTMTTQEMISQLNASLVTEQPDIKIIDYVKLLNEKIFNIGIAFIDDFINLVDKDNCCIDHELLMKYGITNLTAGSYDVKKIIERNDGQERADYTVSQLADRIIYLLNPTFFKKILIRSRNTDKYANYYLLLEKCIKYYNDFEKLKLEHKINEINKIKLLKLDNGQH